MSETLKLSKKIGIWLASLHTIVFFIMVIQINLSKDPQAPMLWIVFAFIDFPISLLCFSGSAYSKFYMTLESPILMQIFYFPYIIHGLLGGIWWYFLPRLVTRRKFGIRWGDCIDWNDKNSNNDEDESQQVVK